MFGVERKISKLIGELALLGHGQGKARDLVFLDFTLSLLPFVLAHYRAITYGGGGGGGGKKERVKTRFCLHRPAPPPGFLSLMLFSLLQYSCNNSQPAHAGAARIMLLISMSYERARMMGSFAF